MRTAFGVKTLLVHLIMFVGRVSTDPPENAWTGRFGWGCKEVLVFD